MKHLLLPLLGLVSLGLGIIKYQVVTKDEQWKWQQKFVEVWNSFINFFVPALAAYYFITIK